MLALTSIGPSGVGKTMIVKRLAEMAGLPFLNIQMSRYSGHQDAEHFALGVGKSYNQAASSFLFQYFSEQKEGAILLFHNIEEAHINVQNALAAMLRLNKIEDRHENKSIDLDNFVIVFELDYIPQNTTELTFDFLRDSVSPSLLNELEKCHSFLFSPPSVLDLKTLVARECQPHPALRKNASASGLMLASCPPWGTFREAVNHLRSITPVVKACYEKARQPAVDGFLSEDQYQSWERAAVKLWNKRRRIEIHTDGDQIKPVVSAPIISADMAKTGFSLTPPPNVRFSDVVGAETVKKQLKTAIKALHNSEKFKEFGLEVPKGGVLIGPPGTGKTMIARAMAGEADLPFINVKGTELISPVSGGSEANIRNLFAFARMIAPTILFIDEVDAIAGNRSEKGTNSNKGILNSMLMEIDGFDTNKDPIFLLAATNLYNELDPAIIRSGRLSLKLEVAAPDSEGHENIIRIAMAKVALSPEASSMLIDICKRLEREKAGGAVSAEVARNALTSAILRHIENKGSDAPVVNEGDIRESFAEIEKKFSGVLKRAVGF